MIRRHPVEKTLYADFKSISALLSTDKLDLSLVHAHIWKNNIIELIFSKYYLQNLKINFSIR